MKQSCLVIIFTASMLSACGDRNEAKSPPAKVPSPAAELNAPVMAQQSKQPAEVDVGAPTTDTKPSSSAQTKNSVKTDETKQSKSPLTREEGLALASKSGCLACHKIETKLVGPAWRDVSKRYQGDPGAKARLVAKVKAGGKGNWTEVTGGVAMPPNSPQVSDENIEKLVTFVLSQ